MLTGAAAIDGDWAKGQSSRVTKLKGGMEAANLLRHACALHDGLCDMSGNVWEWVWDSWKGDYGATAVTDPTGAEISSNRGFRGGCAITEAARSGLSVRNARPPGHTSSTLGGRLVRSDEKEP